MFELKSNEKIGKYLKKLISGKYDSNSAFCDDYIGLDKDGENLDKRDLEGRISKILKGRNSIQLKDLPVFTKLLDVSCEAILSAGESCTLNVNHMTNYEFAFSKSEEIWEQYINRNDKIILNIDEYGKNVIDYALENGNYKLLQYLVNKNYIWFVDINDSMPSTNHFGAGTSIKSDTTFRMDVLNSHLAQNDCLRIIMIGLAVENNDIDMLEKLHARELPSMYCTNFYMKFNDDISNYYDEEAIAKISKADNDILDYFSQEFQITNNQKKSNTFVFPYSSELIDMLIKENSSYSEAILKRYAKHNKNTYEALQNLLKISVNCINSKFNGEYGMISRDDKHIKAYKATHFSDMIDNIYFDNKNKFVSYVERYDKRHTGLITNIISVKSKSPDMRIQSLIDDVNDYFEKIVNIKDEFIK